MEELFMTTKLFVGVAGLALLAMGALPAPAAERHAFDTRVPEAAKHLPMLSRLPATNQLHLVIGLPLRNQDILTNLVRRLYDPASANFHAYLTPGKFAEQFGPTEQDYQKVMDYAKSNRLQVVRTFGNRALLVVSGSVADVEKTFQVRMGLYQHPTENRHFYAPDTEPSIDTDLPVIYIRGLDNYVISHPVSPRVHRSTGTNNLPASGSSTNGTYIGHDFRNAYAFGSPLTGAGQVVGLIEGEGYHTSDITQYEASAGLPSVPLVNVTSTYFTPAATNDTGECSLDIEMIISMAYGVTQVNIYEAATVVEEMEDIVSTNNGFLLPNQVSSSWSDTVGNPDIVPQLLQMAAQGQTFFQASGDWGAYGSSDIWVNPTSANNIGLNYMTLVGGTELVMNGNGASYHSETVWNGGVAPSTNGVLAQDESGGGILVNVPIPFYQQTVSMSLNQGSTQWRNSPDVSMCADGIYVVDDDLGNGGVTRAGTSDGTSAAAPLWAAFAALVNQQAAAEGKPPIGFLNPALYAIAQSPSYATCFNDTTNGNNTNLYSPNLYYATKGYDLCTGWGSPTGTNLINALADLAGPVFVDFNYSKSSPQLGTFINPFSTLAQGTNAVKPFGTIFIITGGSSSETMSIHKPMTITAMDGAATIGP
jgi:subtilase family serine protease